MIRGGIFCITSLLPHCGNNQWTVSPEYLNGYNVSIGIGWEVLFPCTMIPL